MKMTIISPYDKFLLLEDAYLSQETQDIIKWSAYRYKGWTCIPKDTIIAFRKCFVRWKNTEKHISLVYFDIVDGPGAQLYVDGVKGSKVSELQLKIQQCMSGGVIVDVENYNRFSKSLKQLQNSIPSLNIKKQQIVVVSENAEQWEVQRIKS